MATKRKTTKSKRAQIAFWRYDLFPYCLSGKVTERKPGGVVNVEGFSGYVLHPFAILSGEKAESTKTAMDNLRAEYRQQLKAFEAGFRARAVAILPQLARK